MSIIELNSKGKITSDAKLGFVRFQFEELLKELKKRELPQNIIASVNESVEQINGSSLSGKELANFINKRQRNILKQIEKELKIVPRNYYRTIWMLFGISGIGIPIGAAFGLFMKNLGLLGIGLPIGAAIGALVGSLLDKKALEEGRQLNLEIKN